MNRLPSLPSCGIIAGLLQADTGKSLWELLGDAINDLCTKYGKPKTFKPTKGE